MKSGVWFVLALLVAFTLIGSGVAASKKTLRHIVIFKYEEDATPEQIKKITDAFRALKDKIPGILAFEHGPNISGLGKDQGFNHVYFMTFEDEAALKAYLPHPEHEKFRALLRKSDFFRESFVVDYLIHE